jgi:hypothetical protein
MLEVTVERVDTNPEIIRISLSDPFPARGRSINNYFLLSSNGAKALLSCMLKIVDLDSSNGDMCSVTAKENELSYSVGNVDFKKSL